MTITVVISLVVITFGTVGLIYRMRGRKQAVDQLAEIYPKVEQLIAIYSLLCWRKADQQLANKIPTNCLK
jgi:hypothetical protein